MTTINQTSLFRDATCAAAAALITMVLGMSFVSATAQPYGAPAGHLALTLQAQPGWFGQPEPAVLVD